MCSKVIYRTFVSNQLLFSWNVDAHVAWVFYWWRSNSYMNLKSKLDELLIKNVTTYCLCNYNKKYKFEK